MIAALQWLAFSAVCLILWAALLGAVIAFIRSGTRLDREESE